MDEQELMRYIEEKRKEYDTPEWRWFLEASKEEEKKRAEVRQERKIKNLEFYRDHPALVLPDEPAKPKPRRLDGMRQSIHDFYFMSLEEFLGCFVIAVVVSIIATIIGGC